MHKKFKRWSSELVPITIKDELDSNGKKQAFPKPWKNGQVYKTLDRNSVGLRTGNKSANVIDIDTKDINSLEEPFKSWVDDRLLFGDTLTVETERGYHFYFYCDFKVKTEGNISNKVDVRGEGGLIFIHSDSNVANYTLISDEEPTSDISEIVEFLSEHRVQKESVSNNDVVGFINLDDESDNEVAIVASSDKKTLDEVVELINKTSANVSRDEWLALMASAYNLIDSSPERLEEPLREWSRKSAGYEHQFEESAFNLAWREISTRNFGKEFKGGTLIATANKSVVSNLSDEIESATTTKRLKEIIENTSQIKSLKNLDSEDSEVRDLLATKINARYKELKVKNDKVKVIQARTILKELAYKPSLEELTKNGENVDMKVYYIGSKYRVRISGKFSDEMAYASAVTHCKLLDIPEVVALAHLDRATVVSSVVIGADYNMDKHVDYEIAPSISAHVHDILKVKSNPIFKLKAKLTDDYDENIINDFFVDVWQGKAYDLIKLTALSIRFNVTKKNQLMLVTPTSFGKTAMMKHLGFGEIGMETLLGGFQGEGIGSDVLAPIQSSGLMLINEVDTALPKRLKELENEMQVKEFGSGGGTRNVGLNFVVFTSTHDTAILKASDEVTERTMLMQLNYEDSKYNLTSSPIFKADNEFYTKVVRNHMINEFMHYLYEADVTKNDLYALQEKYRLHPSEDLHLLSQEIFTDVVKAIKSGKYGTKNSRGEWSVTKKRDIRELIESYLLDHDGIDIGKYVALVTSKLYTGVTRKVNGVVHYIVNTELSIADEFEDLDLEEL